MPLDLARLFLPARKNQWLRTFLDLDVPALERALITKKEAYWQKLGQRRALLLFQAAARRVPAYRDFLRRHRVRPTNIKTAADFAQVPPTDKTNYIDAYPLAQRCWDGQLQANSLIAVSSGTSGQPQFWPRGDYEEFEAAVIHELAYRSLFQIHRRRTLLIIGFPMGVYVSGVATLLPSWLVAQRGYALTVVSVGNNKAQMLSKAQELSPHFEQTILVGHPFFIKDVVETGRRQKIDWAKMNLKLMFCSEGFTETWREYLMGKASAQSAINTYGSSETLLIGHETPASLEVRQAMDQNADLRQTLAGSSLTPQVFQYNPLLRYIENIGQKLFFTSASGIPLLRFDLHDSGRTFSLAQAEEAGIKLPRQTWQLPFVTLDGRSDQTIIFYAANIYPEHIHLALNDRRFLPKITGRFAMRKDYLKNMDQFLEINVELQGHARPSARLATHLENAIVRRLGQVNLEYRFLQEHLEKDLRPVVALRAYQDPAHFPVGLKPRYIIKNKPGT